MPPAIIFGGLLPPATTRGRPHGARREHAFTGELLCGREADSTAGAGDEGDFPIQLSHRFHSPIDVFKTTGHIKSMPRESVKEQIIAAAVETLHRKGFNGTSVQDITDAAKVPKGSFYNHFDSKEELAVEALDRYWQWVLAGLRPLSDAATPPVDRLKRYFRHLAERGRMREYRTGCMIGNLSAEMPEQSRLVRERLAVVLAAWSRAIESCVREAQTNGSMRRDLDARTVAAFLLNSFEGAILRSKVDRDAASFAVFEEVVFTALAP
jgi:TetR/AcrR family transcriptional repressor of nem operon